MAKATNLRYFIGTDCSFQVITQNTAETACIDVTGWTISFMVKRHRHNTDLTALVTKTPATITGTFNSVPATNTQVALITLTDTDTASLDDGLYYWEFKRTDDGAETVLAYGQIEFVKGVHA